MQGSINLADYIGWESSFNLDRESHTLALVFKYDDDEVDDDEVDDSGHHDDIDDHHGDNSASCNG